MKLFVDSPDGETVEVAGVLSMTIGHVIDLDDVQFHPNCRCAGPTSYGVIEADGHVVESSKAIPEVIG